jgi:DNA processing protein
MSVPISDNTHAILLLMAPLLAGRDELQPDLLTRSEFQKLARVLNQLNRQPSDLLGSHRETWSHELKGFFDADRFERLLSRGSDLAKAIEQWQTHEIWVVSQTEATYPTRLFERLKDLSPPVVYGCGDPSLLNNGGLAVVGSRHVDDWLIEYTEGVGRLAAKAKTTVISGGARGIDQAAMRGALNEGGNAVGILADSLARAVSTREHRKLLDDGSLVLICPYDPSAGFNIGNAMSRNKLIYALSDAALVVSSDYEKGGTWAGAIEQLEKLHLVPVYVRGKGEIGNGLHGLQKKGAMTWPEPISAEALEQAIKAERSASAVTAQMSFLET